MSEKPGSNRTKKVLSAITVINAVILVPLALGLVISAIYSSNVLRILSFVAAFLTAVIFLFNLYLRAFLRKRLLNPLGIARFIIEKPCRDILQNYGAINDVDTLIGAFTEIAATLEDTRQKMHEQTTELQDKNWELQEANLELEASQGQLQAIIEQLNESEQKYHSLVKNIPEVVCVVAMDGAISFINHVSVDVLGYDKSEMKNISFLELIDTEKCTLSLDKVNKALEYVNKLTLELHLIKKDGSSILAEAIFTYYTVNNYKLGLQTIIRDITDKRAMENEVVQRNRELAILNTVSKSLTSTLDMDELLDLIVNEVSGTLCYPACSIGITNAAKDLIEVKAFTGPFFNDISEQESIRSIDTNHDIVTSSFDKGQVIKTDDLPEDMILKQINNRKPEEIKLRELLCLPVKLKNEILGLLFIGSYGVFNANEIGLLSSIANNAAVAINNAVLYDVSKNYFIKTIDTLIAAIEAKDKYTEGHSQRVSRYAARIARKLELNKEQVEDIRVAGILHDIGKIGISDNILAKPGKLSEEEYDIVKQHPAISNKILYPIGFSERTLKAIAFHHERYDGKGYPFRLTGNDISIEAQIISVADAYDAMTSDRPYRPALSSQQALRELVSNKMSQFSPKVVDAFVEIVGNH